MSTKSETNSQNIELSPEQQEKVLSHVLTRFKVMKNYRDQLDPKVIDWLKLYNSVQVELPDAEDWRSNVFVPYTYILITQIVPKLRKALFGESEFITCEARSERFMNVENKMARWMEAKLHEDKFEEVSRTAILAACKYPIAPMKVRWVEKTKTVKGVKKILGVFNKKTVEQKTVRKAVIESIEYWDFWWDPLGTTNENCKDFVHRTLRNFEHIQTLGNSGFYKNTADLQPGSYPNDIAQIRQEIDLYQTAKETQAGTGYNEVELLEYWGKYDIDGDGVQEDIIVTVGNRSVFMKCQLNTYRDGQKQIEGLRPLVEDGQYAGMPLIKVLESPQNELNTIRNQRLDNRNFQLGKKWMMREDAEIDTVGFSGGPGTVIKVENFDDVKEIIFKDVSTTASIEEANVKTEMQQVSGAPDFLKLPDSATGVNVVSAETANRFDDMFDNLRLQFETILNMWFSQYYMFASEEEIFSLVDPVTGKRVFDKVTPDELAGEYYFRLKPSSAGATLQKQQLLVQVLNILGKDPSINQRALKRGVLNAFKFNNVDEILTPPPPTPAPVSPGMPGAVGNNPTLPGPINPVLSGGADNGGQNVAVPGGAQ
jgi:hypothetical protein